MLFFWLFAFYIGFDFVLCFNRRWSVVRLYTRFCFTVVGEFWTSLNRLVGGKLIGVLIFCVSL